jgi:uncharacterized SAM-binding protein YcdF (DUF218 family)
MTPGAPVAPALSQVRFIVVLESGFTSDASRPIEMRLNDDSLARLAEGVRVSRLWSCCKLIVSGGPAPNGARLEAQSMAQLAEELGVSHQDIMLDRQSRDTEEEALHIAPIVRKQPFIVVTEASHRPRAMALLRQGTQPIADPIDFRTSSSKPTKPRDLFPDAEELRGTQRA